MAADLSVYEIIEKHLFESKEIALTSLTLKQLEIKERLMLCVSKRIQNPLMLDSELVRYLINGCGGSCPAVSQTQAYRDVAALTKIVGNIQLASKAWYRYMIVEGAKEGYEVAKTQKDSKGMAANLDKIGKYTRADKDDDAIDWEQMFPPSFEPSDDITLLDGIQPIKNLEDERKNFRALFKGNLLKNVEDIIPVK